MTGEAIALLTLGIGGAASIVGGFVFYRGSTTAGKRAVGAAFTAAGVAMWLILVAVTPLSMTSSGSPDPVVTQQAV